MFGHKTARQRLKDHFILRLNEASDDTIKAEVIERMAENLVIVSEDTMALTHQHLINEASPYEQTTTGEDLGDNITRWFGSVDTEAITKAGKDALRGVESAAMGALKGAQSITKSAQDSFYAARVNNDEELLQEAISIIENADVEYFENEIELLREKINLPDKWLDTLYYRAKATIASRRK